MKPVDEVLLFHANEWVEWLKSEVVQEEETKPEVDAKKEAKKPDLKECFAGEGGFAQLLCAFRVTPSEGLGCGHEIRSPAP